MWLQPVLKYFSECIYLFIDEILLTLGKDPVSEIQTHSYFLCIFLRVFFVNVCTFFCIKENIDEKCSASASFLLQLATAQSAIQINFQLYIK